jgi:predicted RNase H-like nuclease
MRFVGVDLAWGARNRSGLCALENGRVLASATVRSDDEIVSWLEPHTNAGILVAVDAPLIVRNPAGTARACDRLITTVFGRYHAGAHAANLGLAAFVGGVRAERLAQRLGLDTNPDISPMTDTRRMIEVYPHPALVALFGLTLTLKYKAKSGRTPMERKAAFTNLLGHLTELRDATPPMDPSSAPRWTILRDGLELAVTNRGLDALEDEIDAFVCAYIASYYWTHGADKCRVVGDISGGYIVTPVTPEQGALLDAAKLRTLLPSTTPRLRATRRARQMSDCGCGCGALVSRRYLPGHDAKHKAALVQKAVAGDLNAEAQLATLGWSVFLQQRRSRIARD